MCLSFFFYFLSLFLSPKLFPFHSIGTREVVTQKNLSGLVPIRDLRLDPSLLCSIPLLALSPNLLIAWLFLSIAYLVAKLRCKWVSLQKISRKSQEKQKCQNMYSHRVPNWTEGMCQSVVCREIFHALQFDVLLFWTVYTCQIISPRGLVRLYSVEFSVLVTCFYSALLLPCLAGLELLVPNLFPSDVKLLITCISHDVPCFQEKGILSEKYLYIWYYSLNVLLTFPFLLKRNEKDRRFLTGSSRETYLIGHVLSAFISKRSPLNYSSKQFAES